ncbi:peptide chain release factor 1 [Cohaesibacter sp. ES.047]|uniref:peptide chain release factor 1 n=1 Tax=Cohaesibacter sp. ES.047 TaxID=1798205 RepID=UPI000BB74ABF|nr:peptide chain release factor 1 [Cohaesibacter sp. ES.047]SNY92409.1 peptide chain release factor 1 [Cohaesibacter sp. ES.047]
MAGVSIPLGRVEALIQRFDAISSEMAAGPEPEVYVKLSRDYAELEPVAKKSQEYIDALKEFDDLKEILEDPEMDSDMRELAQEDYKPVEEKIESLASELQVLLLPKDAADNKSAILEVRAGTGGDEAALFAGDLFRMYQRYAEDNGWKVSLMSVSEGDVGGYKEIIASISGTGVFAKMKFESGVHRVQRVPETESGGRIHTSAATVAVLPEAEEVDIDIRPDDIRIDTMRASGAGGQHVNTTDSAVRITHLPTGIVVTSSEKSQHQNRANAMKVLQSRLLEAERDRADNERADARRGQVGSGDRSERIRTYNFPQGRVTDHRINLTLYKLEKVLTGEALGELIDALIAESQAQLLAAVEADVV